MNMPYSNTQTSQQPRHSTLRDFMLLGFGVLAIIGAGFEAFNDNWVVALPVAGAAALSPLIVHLSKRPKWQHLPERFATAALSGFIVLGGLTQWHSPANTLWFPIYPLAFFFLAGLRVGAALTIAGAAMMCVTYAFYPSLQDMPRIPLQHFIQLLSAYAMASCTAYLYERLRERHAALLGHEADADALTGLVNRRGALRVLAALESQARRHIAPFSIALVDLDHFKAINDTYGHPVGDEALRAAAAVLQLPLRSSDTLARWGGEEFIVLLPHTELAAAMAIAERLRAQLAAYRVPQLPPITASLGVAQFRSGDTTAQLVQRADAALYRAKELGRNRVEAPADMLPGT